MSEEYNKAFDRIRRIADNRLEDYDEGHTGSWLLLFQEFNRRMAYWAKMLNKEASGYSLWIDIAHEINHSWTIDKEKTSETNALIASITKYTSFIESYLNWEKHKSFINQLGYATSLEPYEPIVLFFELGKGWIHNDGTGYYEIGRDRLKRPKIESFYGRPQILELNKDAFHKADLEYQLDRNTFFKNHQLT
jgi:hypothetical protein